MPEPAMFSSLTEHFVGFDHSPQHGKILLWELPLTKREAGLWVRKHGDAIAASINTFRIPAAQIRYKGMNDPFEVTANMASPPPSESNPSRLLSLPHKLDIQSFARTFAAMNDDERPQGIMQADGVTQVIINPAAKRLFKLPSVLSGCGRDTSTDWYAIDLEQKRQNIRDAGDPGFEMNARIVLGDGTWKQVRYLYQWADESRLYLLATSTAEAEIIAAPELVAV